MFQFTAFPLHDYGFIMQWPSFSRPGFPIRISPDRWLCAPTRSFSQLFTSFIGSWCQGIHPLLLLAWPINKKFNSEEKILSRPRRGDFLAFSRIFWTCSKKLRSVYKKSSGIIFSFLSFFVSASYANTFSIKSINIFVYIEIWYMRIKSTEKLLT